MQYILVDSVHSNPKEKEKTPLRMVRCDNVYLDRDAWTLSRYLYLGATVAMNTLEVGSSRSQKAKRKKEFWHFGAH